MYLPQQTSAPANPQTKAELKEQIKATIEAAQEAAREAGQAGGGRGGARPVVVGIPPTPTLPPGFTIQNGFGQNDSGMPPEVRDISVAFFIMCAVMVIGWPIARALGKRLERRPDLPAVNAGMSDQLVRIEQAVDAMSIEIERISESQRFLAKLQSGQGAVPGERR